MRRCLILTTLILPQPVFAHVGHLGDLAGHSHWIALGALGIATVVGTRGTTKGPKKDADTPEQVQAEPDTDEQEATA